MNLSVIGEVPKSNKHVWYPPPLCFWINCHLERAGLDLYPPPPLPHNVLISHLQTSRLSNSVWEGGGNWDQGEGAQAPMPQAGRVTNSDGGGRVRMGG
jgi:hypothetical protein